MPEVPIYKGRTQKLGALPGPRLNAGAGDAEAFGGGASLNAATSAGVSAVDSATKIAIQHKQNADEVRFLDADLQLSKLQVQNELAAKQLRGKDAAGALDVVDAEWNKGVEQVMGGLSNNQQRAAVSRAAAVRRSEMNKSVQMHMLDESIKLDDATTKDYVTNSQNEAALNYNDPDRVAAALIQQEGAIIGYGKRRGESDESIKKAIDDAKSTTHTTVIEAMLGAGDVAAADAYYKANKKEIIGGKADAEYIKAKSKAIIQQAKFEQEKAYDENARQTMLDMFDRKITLSELQRRYRAGIINEADYSKFESKMVKPEYLEAFKENYSDPVVFNEIRQAQLSGTKSKRELLDMINDATDNGKLSTGGKTGDDAKYLTSMVKDTPPTPREQRIDSQANNLRSFGQRYAKASFLDYAQKNDPKKIENRKVQRAEAIVNEFLKRVDDQKADGERVDEIAKEVISEYVKKDHPEIARLEDMPHIIVDVDGKVSRLMNADQKTKQKPRYKIVPMPAPAAPEKKTKK